MTAVLVPAKRALRARSAGSVAIKGAVSQTADAGLFPGYSASGQDVWLEDAPFQGEGLVLSAVGARCGKVFFAEGHWGVVANTTPLFPEGKNSARYLWYLVNQENWWLKGGAAQPYVRVEASLEQPIFLPAPQAQVAIADFLDRETQRIDEAADALRSLDALLQERSQALIAAAVTGQLDVEAMV